MKKVLQVMFLSLFFFKAYAGTIRLDYSDDFYDSSSGSYFEDGFTTTATNGFHSVKMNDLAWYETDNLLSISSEGSLFNLVYLRLPHRAFAGLTFESSKGGLLSVGSISGYVFFDGDDWQGIDSFTVRTSLSNFDILTRIESIVLDTTPVAEPSTLILFIFCCGVLVLSERRKNSVIVIS
ncbi:MULTISPECIES: hypothetical protein [unclassified Agarivorans]|uniref:hypothetical protein n=1 Tax=unclassified Agarivorans TaxID=2636026 RepID=UPI0026E44DA4|nr:MULTISPECIES: hypothetical protein [unclassified Agarivorans]MDO6685803.1 hypothetical protein [Agarivorans sp. 3_MG-2023]MDO6716082.1 hypothetical protein [Agarivorans sp. 2_MG-2023]